MKFRSTLLRGSALVLFLLAFGAQAQPYPNRPVRIIVPYPPGSGTDIVARLLGQRIGESWGQPIVVDNRPGAGGTIGNALAATAPADGYTLLMTANGPHAIAPSLYPSLPYDIFKDYAAISLVSANPYVLIRRDYDTWARVIKGAGIKLE